MNAEGKVRAIKLTVELYKRLMSMGLPATEYEGEIRHLGDKVRVRRPDGVVIVDQMITARVENCDNDIIRLFVSRITEVCDPSNGYFVAKISVQAEYALCIFGVRFEYLSNFEERIAALEVEVAKIVTELKRPR